MYFSLSVILIISIDKKGRNYYTLLKSINVNMLL